MYQELQIFQDNFDGQLLWGTEGNDLPIPTLAKGDVFELPGAHWWEESRHQGTAYRVVSVSHVFTDTGPGPECNYLMKIVIEQFKPEESDLDLRAQELECELERESQKVDFLEHIATTAGGLAAPTIFKALVSDIVANMKSDPAHGIEDADNAWHEAAIILNSNGHVLAQMMQDKLLEKIQHALRALSQTDRIALWIWCDGLETWMSVWDDLSWDKQLSSFDPTEWNGVFDQVERYAMNLLTAELPDIEY
jgi:hypothetical protein